jgi:hypothetical protein
MNTSRIIHTEAKIKECALKLWKSTEDIFRPENYGKTWFDDIREHAVAFRETQRIAFHQVRIVYNSYSDDEQATFLNQLTFLLQMKNLNDGMPPQQATGICPECDNYLVDHNWVKNPEVFGWEDMGSGCFGLCVLPPVEILRLVRQSNYRVEPPHM